MNALSTGKQLIGETAQEHLDKITDNWDMTEQMFKVMATLKGPIIM